MSIMKRVLQILSGLFGKNSSTPTPTPTPEIILITPDDIPVVTRPVVSRTIVYPPTPVEEKKMSSITPDLLLQFAPALGSDAGIVADILNASEVVGTPLRLAHFLAQAGHESILFSATTENLNYSADGLANTWPNRYSSGRDPKTRRYLPNALANRLHRKPEAIANNVYANRMGNGNEASGDGWKYRGRGYFQLTGKNNYREYSQYEYGDNRILDNPDRVVSPQDAIKSSIWYWEVNGLNRFADKDDVWSISRAINIGNPNSSATPNGMNDRIAKLRKAKQLLKI